MKSKRFIDQVIDRQTWRGLSPTMKLTWIYLWMNCDEAGVYEVDADLFQFENGFALDLDGLRSKLGDFLAFCDGLILIKKFIFVNNGALKQGYNPHKPVFRAIEKNNLILNSNLNEAWFKLGGGGMGGDGDGDGDGGIKKTHAKNQKIAIVDQDPQQEHIHREADQDGGIIRKPDIPELEEFLAYAKKINQDVDPLDVRAKFIAWRDDGWRSKGKVIRNWRSKLAHTVPYMGRVKTRQAAMVAGHHAQDSLSISELIAQAEKEANT